MGESMLIETSTTAIDFVARSFQLSDGSVVNCLIYDTCGQERYNAINTSYYKKADVVLLVYDISSKNSFDVIKNYYCQNIKQFCKKNIPIILLGNKTDRENFREVKTEEGVELALKEKYKFKETSCLKNENVADAFEALIEMWNIENQKKQIFQRNRRNSLDGSIKKKEAFKKINTFSAREIGDLVEEDKNISLKLSNESNKKKGCCS